jgi:3-methyladenine DNA glycosylase AlkD
MSLVIEEIRNELIAGRNEEVAQSSQRFFKEQITCYGMKTRIVTSIAKRYWKQIKNRDKSEIFGLCEELYQSGLLEESFVVSSWMAQYSSSFEREDINVFKNWINLYITNWAACDGFCNHAVGDFIVKYPDSLEEIKSWTHSDNRWMRRAAAVSLIVPAKQGKFLNDIFWIADTLLADQDDMVRKGYGWMLKEASRKHQGEVFSYVMRNKKVMSRVALRYAIELLPPDLKKEAMIKDRK